MTDESIFGVHAVHSVLEYSPQRVLELWVLRDSRNKRLHDLQELAARHGLSIHRVPRKSLDRLAGDVHHQGVLARCRGAELRGEAELSGYIEGCAENPLFLVLDGIQDPHNLGACLRSAEAAGASAVIFPKDRAAGLSPAVYKSAVGAAERLALFQVTNLARSLRILKEHAIHLVGTTGHATQSIFTTRLTGPLALLMGTEEKGLRRLTREACDELVYIPMQGQVESLNVAVATGICLFEAVRQRTKSIPEPI